jgi:FKBP-type peptidyl-prolyl cis-trans isomerase
MKVHPALAFVVLLAVATLGSGCDDSNPLAPSLGIPFTVTDITVGTGTTAATGQTIRVYYTGWLYSTTAAENKGSQFDANTTGTGFGLTLGVTSVIQGWQQGIPGMKVGGKRRLIIPPELAYGTTGAGNGAIPGNATLIFEIELLAAAG